MSESERLQEEVKSLNRKIHILGLDKAYLLERCHELEKANQVLNDTARFARYKFNRFVRFLEVNL